MRAYKVLDDGRSKFTGWEWPLPTGGHAGEWVRAEGPIALCVNGIHASTTQQLPHWLGNEIWEIELTGEIVQDEAALVAAQGRLVRRIEAWDEAARLRFTEACLARAREIAARYPAGAGLVDKIELTLSWAAAAAAGYFTAMLAGESDTGRHSGPDYDAAFGRERANQANWLTRELELSD